MTDRTPAERLRDGLTAAGVKWSGFWIRDMPATQYRHDGIGWTATEHKTGKVYVTSTDLTPEQVIAATVGVSHDLTGLWREWESVLFANVTDEVAQDNLNECVHALLDRAATAGAGTCHIVLREGIHGGAYQDVYECDRCGEQMSVGTVMGESEPPNFCIRCGGKRVGVEP